MTRITLIVLAAAYLTAAAIYVPEIVRLWVYWTGGPGADTGVVYRTR